MIDLSPQINLLTADAGKFHYLYTKIIKKNMTAQPSRPFRESERKTASGANSMARRRNSGRRLDTLDLVVVGQPVEAAQLVHQVSGAPLAKIAGLDLGAIPAGVIVGVAVAL